MTTLNYNLTRPRLAASIARIRERVASAECELAKARDRHAESVQAIASGKWIAMDAICADPGYVADFERRLAVHRRSLNHHTALFAELHGKAVLA